MSDESPQISSHALEGTNPPLSKEELFTLHRPSLVQNDGPRPSDSGTVKNL